MFNPYAYLRKIARSIHFQNLFTATKELNHIKLFRNDTDLSNFQEQFLSLLYHYDAINRDILLEGIDKNILDNDCYCECYMIWKNKKGYKKVESQDARDLSLVAGKKCLHPK
jgi:hypothetical protein